MRTWEPGFGRFSATAVSPTASTSTRAVRGLDSLQGGGTARVSDARSLCESPAAPADAPPGSRASALRQPGIPCCVTPGVVGVQVNEAPLDQKVPDLEDVAPPASAPFRHAGPPGPVLVLPVAGALHDENVRAGEDVGEFGVVVLDGRHRAPDVGEQLTDLLLAGGQAPLGEHDLRVVGEEVQDAASGGRHPGVVECLEVLEGNGLALLVSHGLRGYGHGRCSFAVAVSLCCGRRS